MGESVKGEGWFRSGVGLNEGCGWEYIRIYSKRKLIFITRIPDLFPQGAKEVVSRTFDLHLNDKFELNEIEMVEN